MKNLMIFAWTMGFILVFGTAWGQTNSFPASGNVGIGTTAPTSLLNIESSVSNSALKIGRTGKSTKISMFVAEGNYGCLSLGGNTVLRGNGQVSHFEGNLDIESTVSNRALKIGATGKSTKISMFVAEGNYGCLSLGGNTVLRGNGQVSHFEGNLDINDGNLKIKGYETSRFFRFTESKLMGAFINYDGTTNVLNIGVNNINSDDITNDLKAISIVRANGNVGIGTTSPTEKLHLKEGNLKINDGNINVSDGNLDINDGNLDINEGNLKINGYNTSRFFRFTEAKLMGAFINYDGTENVLNIGVNNINSDDVTNDLKAISIVRANGNVGIGTTTPQNKLDINGTARAKEILVEEGWGDYVFLSDYQLPTLKEEAQHIQEKGHLSGFQSAEEMNGEIQLGDVTKRQQVKIEEMMLHMIEMNETNEAFRNKIETLEAKIKALEEG